MKFLLQSASIFLSSLLVFQPLWAQSPAASPGSDLQVHLVGAQGGASVPAGFHESKGFEIQVTDGAGAGVSDAAVVLRLPDEGPSGSFSDGSHAAIAYTDASGRAQMPEIQWAGTAGTVTIKVTATKATAHAGMLFEEKLTAAADAKLAPPAVIPTAEKPATPSLPGPATVAQPAVSVRQPGTPAAVVPAATASDERASREPLPAKSSAAPVEPAVSVTNGSPHHGAQSSSHKKWIILAVVVAAGAGAGIAMAGKGKSSSTSSSSSSLSIGTPTVSVGHP